MSNIGPTQEATDYKEGVRKGEYKWCFLKVDKSTGVEQVVPEKYGPAQDEAYSKNKFTTCEEECVKQLIEEIKENYLRTPLYIVLDIAYVLPEAGNRSKVMFISWVPEGTKVFDKMIYGSSIQTVSGKLGLNSIQAHCEDLSELEYKVLLDKCGTK